MLVEKGSAVGLPHPSRNISYPSMLRLWQNCKKKMNAKKLGGSGFATKIENLIAFAILILVHALI